MRESLVEMRTKLAETERAAQEAATRAEATVQERDNAREALGKVELQTAEVRTEMAALASDLERTNGDVQTAQSLVGDLVARAVESRERERGFEVPEVDAAHSDEERRRLEAELARARAEIATAETTQSEVSKRAGDLRERVAALTAERDASEGPLGHARCRRRTCATCARVDAGRNRIARRTNAHSHAHLDGLRHGVSDLDAKLDIARREREATANTLLQLESDVRGAEADEREAAHGGERHRTRLAEIEAELGMLVSQFAQNPATDEECHDVEARFLDESDEVMEELPRLREELARLSANVNLNAEAEREELAERDTFLRTQLEDLASARETLLQSIKEIEAQSQAQFNETFEKVAAAFNEMYTKLFPGGTAKMWQTNPENLSETGVEISVQPPGKKLMALAALSGGQRAMVAAALIFALIKVKPSPFYLLDEVDAALDDANVDRFSAMVRELASESQMIIVTHNKKTMELADRMYGVTMREPGVSTLIAATLSAERHPELALA